MTAALAPYRVIASDPPARREAPTVNPSLLTPPQLDPTPIFEIFRGNFAAELLTAAVAHFRVFDRFAGGPKTADELRTEIGLAERPAAVLLTALRAFGLLVEDAPAGSTCRSWLTST